MWLRRAPEKYIAGAALDRADLTTKLLHITLISKVNLPGI
jgi:hypothetical protein